MMKLDLVIGSGGVLSHAPNRLEAALMMLDGFELEGITQIAVDSIFMMPHLGVLASVHPEAAQEIFLHDCLVNICYSIVPVYTRRYMEHEPIADVLVDGVSLGQVKVGEVSLLSDIHSQRVQLQVIPMKSDVNIGAGKGKELQKEVEVGSHGLILDGRNRPLSQELSDGRAETQKEIFRSLGLAEL